MHSNEYEEAFGRFLEQAEYDEAEDALFSLARAAFQAGWLAAGGSKPEPVRMFELLRPEASGPKP